MSASRRTPRRMGGFLVASLALAGCQSLGTSGDGATPGTALRVASRAADAGDYETAATLYQRAFAADPRSTEALLGLGRSYNGLGQPVRAEQALTEAASRRPEDPLVLLELGRVQIAAGRPAQALVHLERAAARAPRDLKVAAARGIALDRLSRHAEAQAVYRAGLAADPTNFALLSNLGLSLSLSGRADEGITILRELARDRAATAQTRGNLALAYGLAGREAEARAALAPDLPAAEIDANIRYYRDLRTLLAEGRAVAALP